ncbi:MAG TPA: DUF6286 domain-containing protein [Propionibacteriaceae bacterium]
MSRSDARSRNLRRRPSRTVPATIVAIVLLALGALTAIAAIVRLVDGSWPTQVTGAAGTVSSATLGSAVVIASGAVLALLGLILLIAGLKRGAFKTAQLAVPAGGAIAETDYVISTRAMARLAAGRADTLDGVDKVSASASGRRVHVQVATTSEQTYEIRERVRQGVVKTLTEAGVHPAPRVTAAVRTKDI